MYNKLPQNWSILPKTGSNFSGNPSTLTNRKRLVHTDTYFLGSKGAVAIL